MGCKQSVKPELEFEGAMARPINTLSANGVSNGNRIVEETEAGSAYRLSDPFVMRPPAGGIFNPRFRVFTSVSETDEEIHHADKAAYRP